MGLKRFLKVFGVVAIILVLIPLFAVNYWWIRIFDFPHLQLTILTFIAILIYFIRFDVKSLGDYLFVLVMVSGFIFQLIKIFPYTDLASYELLPSEYKEEQSRLKIFTANVYQKNDSFNKVIAEARQHNADVMLFTETHQGWINQLSSSFNGTYKYQVKVPQDNTYGMYMLSRFPISNAEVKHLVDDSIPSIHGVLKLPNQKQIKFHAIHPTPPMPQENPMSTERDAELMQVALESRDSDLPVVVMGDFNDVAWSQSTKRFQQISGLLDMRKGRGFYHTYNAHSVLFRWPLDHLFISSEFRYGNMERGDHIGSDHFPFIATIYLEEEGSKEQKLSEPSKEQLEMARKEIKKAN